MSAGLAQMRATAVVEREVVIPNKEGLHFRPIMQFVDIAQRYKAVVTVHCDDREADGRSPMEMLMLVATQGTKVRVVADGEDAEDMVGALVELVESGFGET
jgi:phosphotransferase system HPr (HPr) family protein